MQVVLTVDKAAVSTQKKEMYSLVSEANRVDAHNSFRTLQDATRALHITTGYYKVLDGLGLLEASDMVGEDIGRIEKKIGDILEEKRRNNLLRTKS